MISIFSNCLILPFFHIYFLGVAHFQTNTHIIIIILIIILILIIIVVIIVYIYTYLYSNIYIYIYIRLSPQYKLFDKPFVGYSSLLSLS